MKPTFNPGVEYTPPLLDRIQQAGAKQRGAPIERALPLAQDTERPTRERLAIQSAHEMEQALSTRAIQAALNASP